MTECILNQTVAIAIFLIIFYFLDNDVEKNWLFKDKYDKEKGLLSKIVIGSFTQYPLMLASAITVHKGQGATIDGVHINLDRGAFSFGQTYVALSRTKKLSDMSLEREIRHSDIKIDQRVVNYYQSLEFEGSK